MTAERHITPRVVAHLAAEHAKLTDPHCTFERAQLVLRQLARWARRVDADDPGRWQSNDSVGQIAAGTGLKPRSIKYAFDVLAAAGLLVTVRRGGGHGEFARGSLRELVLDPVDNVSTGARQRAPVERATGARSGATGARNGFNWGTQRAPSVYSSVYSSVSRGEPVADVDRSDPGAYDPFAARSAR